MFCHDRVSFPKFVRKIHIPNLERGPELLFCFQSLQTNVEEVAANRPRSILSSFYPILYICHYFVIHIHFYHYFIYHIHYFSFYYTYYLSLFNYYYNLFHLIILIHYLCHCIIYIHYVISYFVFIITNFIIHVHHLSFYYSHYLCHFLIFIFVIPFTFIIDVILSFDDTQG